MSLFDEFFGMETSEKKEGVASSGEGNTQEAVTPKADTSFGGISFEEEEPKKKAEKPAEKKSEASKGAGKKSSGSKKGTDFDVKLPVTVKARGWSKILDGTGKKKVSEIFKNLSEQGYREVELSDVNAVYDSGTGILYVVVRDSIREDDVRVEIPENGITIADGELKMELTASDFEGLDADEICVKHLVEKWVSQNPRYAGCTVIAEGDVAYPVYQRHVPENEELDAPVTILVNGAEQTVENGGKAKDVIKALVGELPSGVTARLNQSGEDYVLSYTGYKETAKGTQKLAKNEKKAEQKYKLPLHVLITTWGGEYDLTSEMFDGKEKINMGDIKNHFKASYQIFGDSSKHLESVYIEEEKTLSLMFTSGRKGGN